MEEESLLRIAVVLSALIGLPAVVTMVYLILRRY